MEIIKGDILKVKHGIIVHGCNCLGLMGCGIALQIKNEFPQVFKAYATKHREDGLILGSTIPVAVNEEKTKWIVNGMTQKTVGAGRQVSYDAVENVFLRTVYLQQHVKNTTGFNLPILYPKIGSGLGGGSWDIIESIIEESIPSDIEHHLYVLE